MDWVDDRLFREERMQSISSLFSLSLLCLLSVPGNLTVDVWIYDAAVSSELKALRHHDRLTSLYNTSILHCTEKTSRTRGVETAFKYT
jgi:hypothetical protein